MAHVGSADTLRGGPTATGIDTQFLGVLVVIAVAALVRLIAIDQPYVDAWAWRQADVGSIARNFWHSGFDLLHPQIDWGGAGPGYVGTEFPLVPWLAAAGYAAFGEHAWIGRAIPSLAFLACLPSVRRIVRDAYGERAALFALAFFAFMPLVVLASRSFTSDMAAFALSIVALDAFGRWMDQPQDAHRAIVATLATALALLVKIPYLIVGLPMLAMAIDRFGPGFVRQPRLWLFALGTLGPAALWYAHAYRLSLDFFPYHMFGDGMLQPVDKGTYIAILWRTFGVQWRPAPFSSLTPLVSILMLAGLFLRPRGRQRWTLHLLLVASFVFLVAAGRGSRFPAYQLSFCLVAAGFAGAAVDAIVTRTVARAGRAIARGIAVVTLAAFGTLAFVLVRDMYAPWARPYADAGAAIDRLAAPDALIVAASELEPMLFYFGRRKGWSFDTHPGSFDPATPTQAPQALPVYRALGARYFATTRFTRSFFDDPDFRGWIRGQGRVVADTPDYLIVDLEPSGRR